MENGKQMAIKADKVRARKKEKEDDSEFMK
jgi:hypothetical protein